MSGLVVHEWIEKSGGSEKVVEQFFDVFPDADLFVLWDDAPGRFTTVPSESWLSATPLRRHKPLALPFMIPTWRYVPNRRAYDWILASSHLFAHHARVRSQPDIPKYVYVHSPARYIWAPELDQRGKVLSARVAAPGLKMVDRARAQEATAIAANSKFVSERIQNTWEREAAVIYPPVDVERICQVEDWRERLSSEEERIVSELPATYVAGISRFVNYKRLDLVIETAERLDVPAVIAGRGPNESSLRERAAEAAIPVHFVISPSDALMYSVLSGAAAFVFPAVEDFGILPVEAQALGTPVVTGPYGGQTETLLNHVTGVVAEDFTPRALAESTAIAMGMGRIRATEHVAQFSRNEFNRAVTRFVSS
ncbi:glycosyltransferase [uncultured Microbacterium sp.]|uniref:glycosyltransferase n=1 Tax=uncultured Microbacterium sp. TaxID=191216 RepID=UPI0025D36C7B|nr:glycosyltransferase [uncultured Microbacterium sp.]